MTKLHVPYSSHISIKFDMFAYLNRGYIDPTDSLQTVSGANWPTVDRQSADFVFNFAAFYGQPAATNYS